MNHAILLERKLLGLPTVLANAFQWIGQLEISIRVAAYPFDAVSNESSAPEPERFVIGEKLAVERFRHAGYLSSIQTAARYRRRRAGLGCNRCGFLDDTIKAHEHGLSANVGCLEVLGSQRLLKERLAVLALIEHARNSRLQPHRHLHAGVIRPVPILYRSHEGPRQVTTDLPPKKWTGLSCF